MSDRLWESVEFASPAGSGPSGSVRLARPAGGGVAEGPQEAGLHRIHWNGLDDRGLPLASGVYLYRLASDETVRTRELTLLR